MPKYREVSVAPLLPAAAVAVPVERAENGVPLDQPLRDARDQFERVYFEYHLARESYSMTRVADRAGLERTHLYRKLKQLGIELSRGRRGERAANEPSVVTEPLAAVHAQPPVYTHRDEYDD